MTTTVSPDIARCALRGRGAPGGEPLVWGNSPPTWKLTWEPWLQTHWPMAVSGESGVFGWMDRFPVERKTECKQNVSPLLGTQLCLDLKQPGDEKEVRSLKSRHCLPGTKIFLQHLLPDDTKNLLNTHLEPVSLYSPPPASREEIGQTSLLPCSPPAGNLLGGRGGERGSCIFHFSLQLRATINKAGRPADFCADCEPEWLLQFSERVIKEEYSMM